MASPLSDLPLRNPPSVTTRACNTKLPSSVSSTSDISPTGVFNISPSIREKAAVVPLPSGSSAWGDSSPTTPQHLSFEVTTASPPSIHGVGRAAAVPLPHDSAWSDLPQHLLPTKTSLTTKAAGVALPSSEIPVAHVSSKPSVATRAAGTALPYDSSNWGDRPCDVLAVSSMPSANTRAAGVALPSDSSNWGGASSATFHHTETVASRCASHVSSKPSVSRKAASMALPNDSYRSDLPSDMPLRYSSRPSVGTKAACVALPYDSSNWGGSVQSTTVPLLAGVGVEVGTPLAAPVSPPSVCGGADRADQPEKQLSYDATLTRTPHHSLALSEVKGCLQTPFTGLHTPQKVARTTSAANNAVVYNVVGEIDTAVVFTVHKDTKTPAAKPPPATPFMTKSKRKPTPVWEDQNKRSSAPVTPVWDAISKQSAFEVVSRPSTLDDQPTEELVGRQDDEWDYSDQAPAPVQTELAALAEQQLRSLKCLRKQKVLDRKSYQTAREKVRRAMEQNMAVVDLGL